MLHGAIVVDKPGGMTSHDVVAGARRALGTRSIGHAGTLDPMATGVLVLLVGEALKLSGYVTSDAKRYGALAQEIKKAFNQRFFDPRLKQYAGGSQTSNALALYLDLVPREEASAVFANLLNEIAKDNYHFGTGIIGTNAVTQLLPKMGASATMYRIATQTTYPSLGHQVVMGATTVCEVYECDPFLSQNMKMFGSLDKFFFRNLGGINMVSPGYRRILIKPEPVGGLARASATQHTVRGLISVEWIKEDLTFDLKVTIPAGTDADIELPMPRSGLNNVRITESGRTVWQSNAYVPGTPGLSGALAKPESVVLHAGSGSYKFLVAGEF